MSCNKEKHESTKEQKETICLYLWEERARRRMVDPPPGAENIQISPFGIIPKPHQPEKWQIILDLSSPRGSSVNDSIDPQLCSLSYARLDDVVHRVLSLGSGALLAKLDIQNAYRIIPVHTDNRSVLGMRWQGAVCLDAALPFSLRSVSKTFGGGGRRQAVMDNVQEWCNIWHSLLRRLSFLRAPESNKCAGNLAMVL